MTKSGDVKEKVYELCQKIGVDKKRADTILFEGQTFLSAQNQQLTFEIHTNDPRESSVAYQAQDMDGLLYHIMADIVSRIAWSNGKPDEDRRRSKFDKELELLGILSSEWAEKRKDEHKDMLAEYPFDDFEQIRHKYFMQMQAEGKNFDEARKIADEKYHVPLGVPVSKTFGSGSYKTGFVKTGSKPEAEKA